MMRTLCAVPTPLSFYAELLGSSTGKRWVYESPICRPTNVFALKISRRHEISMKSNTPGKSSFTLAPAEHAQVLRLRRLLKARSNTEVIRRSLKLLEESVSREELRRQFREAAASVRASTLEAMQELDHLAGDGLHDA
jgi:hypothetical protein